jgi:hypothetical protein
MLLTDPTLLIPLIGLAAITFVSVVGLVFWIIKPKERVKRAVIIFAAFFVSIIEFVVLLTI